MPTEVLNMAELTTIIAATLVSDDHSDLLRALHERYPATPFSLIQRSSGQSWDAAIVDQDGNRVSDNLVVWVDQQLELTGGNVQEVWNRHKNSGMIRTGWAGECLYLTASYGSDPDMFWQLKIDAGAETMVQQLFDPQGQLPPEERWDLINGHSLVFGDDERQVLSPAVYRFEELVNMRRFLRDLVESEKTVKLAEMPEMERKTVHVQDIVLGPEGRQTMYDVPFLEMDPGWLDRMPPAYRLFRDWQESSAGRGRHKFCDHWFCHARTWTDEAGRQRYALTPQWAEADGGLDLPEISPDWEASPYAVVDELLQFDQKAGYPMAWFFYAVHGNRVSHSAAGIVAIAIRDGLMKPLPEHDENVLLRWREQPYGF